MFASRKQILPIGVDVGFDSIKLLQLQQADGKLSVLAAARLAMSADNATSPATRYVAAAELIRRTLRNGEFVGKRIVTAMPREYVAVKNLRLPQMPVNELPAAVEFEARNIFPFDTEHAHVRFLHAGEVRQGSEARQEVLVLAAKQTDVDEYIEMLHKHGLQLDALDFEPAAIYRSRERFIRRKDDEQDVNVLVDIGARRSQVIIGRGREISFYKPIDVGGIQLHEAVARKLRVNVDEARSLRRRLIDAAVVNVTSDPTATAATKERDRRDPVRQAVFDATRSHAEELAREIGLCLRYFSVTFRGQRPQRVRLTGGEAGDPHLLSVLSAALPVPVEPARPLHSINTDCMKPADRRGFLSEWTTALGLCLKNVPDHFGARDGDRRAMNAHLQTSAANAEVIDLATALRSSDAVNPGPNAVKEVAHA